MGNDKCTINTISSDIKALLAASYKKELSALIKRGIAASKRRRNANENN